MQTFYGTKKIQAKPMNRLDYNMFRGWQLPADENGLDEGYLVEYLDGGKPNTATHVGYVSWSPKEQFEAEYQPIDELSFGHALVALKEGKRVARAGWNGKGMWLFLIVKSHWETTRGLEELDGRPWVGIKTVDDQFMPWVASQSDMQANDWQIVA